MKTRGLLLVVCVALAAGAFACRTYAARATGLHRIATGTEHVASDGGRFIAWQTRDTGALTVFDTRAARTRSFRLPESCPLADEESAAAEDERGLRASDGRFLVSCEGGAALFEVSTASLKRLPNTTTVDWAAVGSRYVEGRDLRGSCRRNREERAHDEPCVAFYSIADGRVTERPRSQVGDVDRPGAPTICPVLRRKVLDSNGRYASYSDGVFAWSTVPVELVRCDRHRIFLKPVGEPRDVLLGGGVLTWDDGKAPPESLPLPPEERHVVLSSYRLATRQRRDYPIPRLPLKYGLPPSFVGRFGYSTHTKYDVVWVATETLVGTEGGPAPGTSAIYVAAF